jgi:hypothetical protein
MELWKNDLELFTKIDHEINRQLHALPEAEVIEWWFQHGYSFQEITKMRSRLKGDCIFNCWN